MKTTAQLILLSALLWPLHSFSEESDASAGTEMAETDTASTAATETHELATGDLLEQQQQADIAALQSPETEVLWLDAGNQQRLALYLPSVEPEAHAGIIIFPDTTTSADWPDFIHPLRTDLTNHGWSTLTLNLPPEPSAKAPPRTLPTRQDSNNLQPEVATDEPASDASSDPVAETDGETSEGTSGTDGAMKNSATETSENTAMEEKAAPPYPELIAQLGSSASQIIAGKGHEKQIIMGVGDGAAWALQFFMDQDDGSQYMVLIDPRDSHSDSQTAPRLISLISQLNAPALDLWFDSSPQAKQHAALRKRTAQRNTATTYTQIRINRQPDAARKRPQWLTKQVRGILESRIKKQMQARPVEHLPAGQLTPGS